MQLRPYQCEAIDAVFAEWAKHRSTLLVLPTGTGKTVVFSEVLARGGRRALVIAHREELLHQAARTLRCRGLSVELERAEEHAATSRGLLEDSVSDVVVASVQTLREKRRRRWAADAFDRIVIDEAHHAAASTYRAVVAHFPEARVLGVTATPDRGDRRGLGDVFESVAYSYDIRTAIREGYLAPIRAKAITVAPLDISQVKSSRGDLDEAELSQAMQTTAVLHEICGPLAREADQRPTLVFCVDVAHSEATATVLAGYVGASRVAVIHGALDREERARILGRYERGEVQFLVNCMVLTEGFDAPQTACVAMCRPTKSRALYAQCIGRGTRLAEGKVDCLVLDFRGNAGKHSLIAPLDVLHPGAIEPKLRKRAEQLAADGKSLDEALEQATREAAEVAERARARAEHLARVREQQHIRADVAYAAKNVDPFARKLVSDPGDPASEAQMRFLERIGLKRLPPQLSKTSAAELIRSHHARRERGLASLAQARLLAKHGLRTNVAFATAKQIISAIEVNGWRCPPQIREAWGKKQAEVADAAE